MIRKIHNPKANIPAVYIPCWLIQVPIQKISHGAKLLYGRLAQWSNQDGTVYRSKNDLKEELGISLRTLGDLIKELKDVGLIDTIQPVKGGISHYIFYDHEWMYEPIKRQLVYKSDELDPMQNPALGSAGSCTTPMQNPAHINNNKIKTNNINISASCESQNIGYTESDGQEGENSKSDYKANQAKSEKNDTQVIEPEGNPAKSDYFENQTKNQALSKISIPQELKLLQEENIFSIPEQAILDWIANRKKKRVPITATAWKKINKELAKCKAHGIDPIEAFETFVANGWQSFKLEWLLKDQGKSQSDSKDSPQSNLKNYW